MIRENLLRKYNIHEFTVPVQILPAYKLFCKVISYTQDVKCKKKMEFVFRTNRSNIGSYMLKI